MRMQEYLKKNDVIAFEESDYEIPMRKEYLLEQIGRGKRVLDVGCAGGLISQLIQRNQNHVWGVELNPDAAEIAEKRGVRVKVANVEDGFPFDDRAFDVVYAGGLLEHLYDTKFFFEECERVIKDDGILLLLTPNLNSLDNRIQILRGGYLSMAGAYPEDHDGARVRFLNLAKIQELCAQTGFVIEEARGIPALEPKGKWIDSTLSVVGRLAPGISKLLMIKARVRRGNA